ncbi:MAG: hypothetical protein N2749_02005 [Clostridia bacterium]|nr:hypothetical protein [Clostridia bacterium]
MKDNQEKFETPFGVFYKDEPIEIITNFINIVGLFSNFQNAEEDDNETSIIVSEPIKAVINGYDHNKNGYKINYTLLPFSLFSYTDEISVPVNAIIKINRINKKVYELFIKPHFNSFLKDISELDKLVGVFEKGNFNETKFNKSTKKL